MQQGPIFRRIYELVQCYSVPELRAALMVSYGAKLVDWIPTDKAPPGEQYSAITSQLSAHGVSCEFLGYLLRQKARLRREIESLAAEHGLPLDCGEYQEAARICACEPPTDLFYVEIRASGSLTDLRRPELLEILAKLRELSCDAELIIRSIRGGSIYLAMETAQDSAERIAGVRAGTHLAGVYMFEAAVRIERLRTFTWRVQGNQADLGRFKERLSTPSAVDVWAERVKRKGHRPQHLVLGQYETATETVTLETSQERFDVEALVRQLCAEHGLALSEFDES